MELEGSLPSSQHPDTGSYPEPDASSTHLPTLFLILSFYLRIGLPNGRFPPGFPNKILDAFLIPPMHATFPANLVLLDLSILIIFDEAYSDGQQ